MKKLASLFTPKDEAHLLLQWLLRDEPPAPHSQEATYWLAQISATSEEKRAYLNQVLHRNAYHPEARRELAILDGRLNPADVVNPDHLTQVLASHEALSGAVDFTCPQCTAPLAFTPGGQSLVCAHCHLAERAMVNRSTFYRHYLDKYDLLSQYFEELYAVIDSQVGEDSVAEKPDQPPDKPPAGLVSLLEHVQMNADFYRVMLGEKGDPSFCAQSFRQFIEKHFRHILPSEVARADPGRPPIGLSVSYVLHAGIGAIVWWLEHGQSWTPEEIADWLHQLSMTNVSLSLEPGGVAVTPRPNHDPQNAD